MKIFFSAKTLTHVNQNAKLQKNWISNAKKIIDDLKWYFEKDEY